MRSTNTLFLLPALLLTTTAAAQTLYALESNGAGAETVHRVFMNCTPFQQCAVPANAFPNAITGTFGGIAWNGQNLLLTSGTTMTTLDPQCNQLQTCPMHGFNQLHDIAMDGVTGIMHFSDGGSLGSVPFGCPMGGIAPARRATVPAPLVMPVTAIDVDTRTNNLWVCDAVGTVAEVTFPSQWSATVVQSFPIAQYPGFPAVQLPIGGMAFDECANRIYLADAAGQIIHMDPQGNARGQCQVALSPGGFIAGLAKRGRMPTPLPGACMAPGMPSCTPQCFTTGGDPTVPNPNLRIEVRDAPWPTGPAPFAFIALDTQQGSLPVGLCGPLVLAGTPAMTIQFRGQLVNDWQATAPCHGTQWYPLPVPNNSALCGFSVFAQWAFWAANGTISLSNGIEVRID